MSDQAPSEGPPVESVNNAPLQERVQSKTWKTRMEAFVELAKAFDEAEEGDAIFGDFVGLLSKFVADSNVNAQDKGLEACCSFAKKAPIDSIKQAAGSIISKTVDKAFGQAKCKPKAQELALLLIEAEAGEAVTEELIKGCGHKQPKIAGAASECLRMAVESFGIKPLGQQPKAIVKLSVSMFDSTVQPVRVEALPLAVQLHRYMGAGLRPSYNDLRTAQQKEIDDAFSSAEKPAPSRMTRSAAVAATAKGDCTADSNTAVPVQAAAVVVEIDASDLADPVDVLGKLPKDFCEKVLSLPKWTEKKELLDKLIEAAGVPKIAPGDYHELVKTLKKLMGDSMVVLVACACTAASLLAKGMRKDFAQGTKLLLATLLDRLKEKDFRVRDAVHTALDNMIGTGKCVGLQDVLDDFCTALGPKGNPKAKVEVYKYLKRSIDNKSNDAVTLKAIKPLTDALVKGVDDSTPEVREGSSTVLGALHATFGPDAMKKILDSLDDKKRKKIESIANATDASAPAAVVPEKSAPKPAAVKKTAEKASSSDSSTGNKKTSAIANKSAPTKAKAAGEKSDAKTESVDVIAGAPVEELDAHVETMYPEAIRTKLSSTAWKERLEGMEEVLTTLQQLETCEQLASDATCRMLVGVLVTAKESNFQVMAKGISIVKLLSEKAVKFSKRAAHWMTPPLVEKLGDVKLKAACSECLLSLAETCTPNFMMTQGIEVLQKQKAPKILENGLLWIKSMCEDFGLKLVKPKQVLDFIKQMLEVANPAVKKSAVEVLVTMRRALGPEMRNLLSDVKPALLTSIDEAFSKIVDEAPLDAPKRQVRGCDNEGAAEEGLGGGEIVSLTAPIAAHLKTIGDANWKERQAAIIAIDDIVSKAKPIGCKGPYMDGACGELWASLKARLKDSNKNLAILVLGLLAKIADAVGPSVDKYAKHVMANMLALISDNKKTVRDAVIQCLSTWSKHISAETVIKYLPVALSVESPAGREDAFRFAADYLAALDKSGVVDLSPILNPVMDGMVFRVAEVRNGAERCLAAIYMCGGKQAIHNVLRDMKPAQLKCVKPICEKAERTALASSIAVTQEVASCPADVSAAPVDSSELKPEPSRSASSEPCADGAVKKAAKAEVAEVAGVSDAGADDDRGKLLQCNRGKEMREKKNGKTKWVLEDAKEVEDLLLCVSDQMASVCNNDLHAKLFNKDFKKQVEGIKELTAFVPDHSQEVIDNLDLLLKMSSLRMVQKSCNTAVLLAVLELLKALTELCVANAHYLSEPEATVILPVLLQEIGSNNEGIRGQIRDVVKRTTQVYPASKIFTLAMEAVQATRNQRSKAEVLTEMAGLVDRLGLDQVCLPSKALPVIANFIGERDSLVRNAACDFIAAAYSSMGEKIWKYVEKKLEPKDKDILEARLRKVKSLAATGKGVVDVRSSMPEITTGDKVPVSAVSQSVQFDTGPGRAIISSVSTPSHGADEQEVKELLQAPTPTICNIRSRFQDEEPSAEAIFSEGMSSLASAETQQQIEGLRALCDVMGQAEGRLVEGNVNEIAGRVQLVLETLLESKERSSADFRLSKHAIHTLHTMCEKQPTAIRALKDSLTGRLLEVAILLSVDAAAADLTEPMISALNEDLLQGLNKVLVEMLNCTNPNHCFTALIRFLYEGATLSGDRVAGPEFVDGVLRCLLQMARNMQGYMPKLDVDMLLYDCHMFLVSHPPSKYRGKEFRPLRLLKTILNELVKIKAEGIRVHLSLVPVETKPTLCSYIELVLQQHMSSRAQTRPEHSAGNMDIGEIFKHIGSKDKEVAKEGFKLLYQYQQQHSDFNLDAFLEGRTPLFREHVHKNLAKVASSAQGGATSTPSSAPVPLQPSSVVNLNPDMRAESSKNPLLDKLQGIRSIYGSVLAGDNPSTASEPTPDAPTSQESSAPKGKSESALPSPEFAAPASAVSSEEGDGVRKSQSVLSLQERLAKLRA